MHSPPLTLALELSSPAAQIALGESDRLIASVDVPGDRSLDASLFPALEALLADHGRRPAELGLIVVSIGPGGFTGLRVSIATAQMLGFALGAAVVGAPTAGVVLRETLDREPVPGGTRVGVALATKRGWTWLTEFERAGEEWVEAGQGRLVRETELAERGDLDVVIADHPGEALTASDRRILRPRRSAEACLREGWAIAARGGAVPPERLLPIYARRPEAVELWERRHGDR